MSDTSPDARRGDTFGFIRRNIRQYGILFALIIIMVFFQVVTGGILFKPVNLTNLFLQNSISSFWRWGCCWSSWPGIST